MPIRTVSRQPTAAHDLNSLAPNGTQAMRLRIGDSYQQISTLALAPAAGAAGTTYADAYAVPSFTSAAQSYVISNQIETTAYDLQWPGSATDPGNRQMFNDPATEASSELLTEGGFGNGVGGSVGDIPTFTYNFPTTYGTLANGSVARNQITPAQEQDTREIFSLLSSYLGVQFEQLATTALVGSSTDNNNNIGVVTGDLSAVGFTSGTGTLDVGGGDLAVVDAAVNWGTSPYGGAWMQAAMQGIMLSLGFGRSYNLPAFQVMGDDPTQGTSDQVLPGIGNLTSGLNLYPAESGDINMYKITLTTPGTLSAETVAQRLSSPSLLDTEVRVFQQNADGSYSAIAQNDNYFGTDSYTSLSLQPGTYFIGVSASGDDAYDPSIPNSGMNGKSTGPYQLRVNFTPLETLGPAQASGSSSIVLTGANIKVNTGTTPFAQTSGSGQVTITQLDPFDVPNVAALNGETFTVTQGSASYSFQFVDTSIANNQAAAGNIAVDFDSTTDTISTVRTAMVTAINDVFTVLVNATGTPFDGDADGTPGGLYNYWFNVAGTEVSGAKDRTIFVDASASSGGKGTITAPYSTISAALAAAASDAQLGLHDIVRIEGNHTGNDNPANLSTISDNQSYNIGTDIFGKALSDGATMVVPRNTTVMIDAGAVLKFRAANIQVGSSSVNVNLSGAIAASARHAAGFGLFHLLAGQFDRQDEQSDYDSCPRPAIGAASSSKTTWISPTTAPRRHRPCRVPIPRPTASSSTTSTAPSSSTAAASSTATRCPRRMTPFTWSTPGRPSPTTSSSIAPMPPCRPIPIPSRSRSSKGILRRRDCIRTTTTASVPR